MNLNIWSCDKDNSIKHLLLLLREEFSETSYRFIDPDETDAKSVRLGSPEEGGYSVYIYTYGQEQDRYGVHLEYPNKDNTNAKDTMEIFDNLSYQNLLDILKVHFN